MQRIIKYTIVTEPTRELLVLHINEKIKELWQPFGSPFVVAYGISQAIVMYG